MTEKEKKEEVSNEEKKKRRFSFSSQFRRASRSRTRPSSVALPKTTPSVLDSTPKTSPPRELHHYLMGERRPHSFHAPDSWVGTPPAALNEYFNTTAMRRSSSQAHLGILPSPAKSAFSNQDKDAEDYVPPVPPIPNEVAIKHYRRRSSQDSASHRMLQSVIRHSTPPVVFNRHSMPAAITRDPKSLDYHPVFADDNNISGAQERANDYKTMLRAPEGSFQPDLPTAESDDLRRDGFQFGFSDESPKRVRDDRIDDDDQPPQLNHDPLPTSLRHGQQPPPMYTNRHMDVSDEDSDRELVRGRSLAPVTALNAKQESDSVSPVLAPVGKSASITSDKNGDVGDVERDDQMRGARVIRYEDTPFVLARQSPDNVAAIEWPSMNPLSTLSSKERPRESAEHSFLDIGHETFVYGSASVPQHHTVNELASAEQTIRHGERASNVESPTLGLLDDAFRTGKVWRVSSLEASVPVSEAPFDVKDDEGMSRDEKADAERAFSPVWFAKSDLQLPTSTRDLGNADGSAEIRATTSGEERDADAGSRVMAVGAIAAPAQQEIRRHGDREPSLSHTLAGASAAAADSDTSTRSAPPSLVVDAAEKHTASGSLSPSWGRGHSIIDPRVAERASDEMGDESNLVTPAGQVPRITTQNGPETPKAGQPYSEHSRPAMSNSHSHGQASFPDFKHQAQQLQVLNSATAAPERSRSMLSQISAMVSDEGSNPYSQTSTGRSTPSTIRRMQPESTVKPSAVPPQIPEEILMSYGGDDGFDLYADHNGVVKDVQDEHGQPLRLGHLQVRGATTQQQPSQPSTSGIATAPSSRDGDRPRYSFERPMSFVSGPEDQDGKPQDQINQTASANATQSSPVAMQHRNQSQQSLHMDTVYLPNPPANVVPPSDRSALRHQPMLASGPSPSKNIFQAVKSIDPSNKTTQITVSSWRPAGHQASQQAVSGSPDLNCQLPQATQASGRVPLAEQERPAISGPQSNPNRAQGQMESHGPRNQFELQQQLLQRQGQYQVAAFRPPANSSSQPAEQTSRNQEKSSSKPRLTSMFKSFGGKTQANLQHTTNSGNTAIISQSKPLPPDPSSGTPLHSVMDRFMRPREASAEKLIDQQHSFLPHSRPNMGQPPDFGQASLQVHSVEPRVDSRARIASDLPNDFSSQQPPSISNVQVQAHQVSYSKRPESGKKKRFSALGALFIRGGVNGDGSAMKYKMSKEGKKAQKSIQAIATPATPNASHRVPQHQQNKPQQSGLAYYPPGQLPPHTIQSRPPLGQKLGPSQPAPNMHPQKLPQPYQQQTQQVLSSREPISSLHSEEASAFLKTKQLAMEHQARQSSLQLNQSQASKPGIEAQPSSAPFQNTLAHTRDQDSDPPPGGYYNHRAEPAPAGSGAYAASLAAREQVDQRNQQQTAHQGVYTVPQAERQQQPPEKQQSEYEQSVQRDHQYERQLEQQAHPETSQDHLAHHTWRAQREELLRQERSAPEHNRPWPNDDAWVQRPRQQQQHQSLVELRPNDYQPQLPYHNAHDSRPLFASQDDEPISPPAVSPTQEPRYDAPPIPAAYSHVSGAFVSPLDRQQQSLSLSQTDALVQLSVDQHNRPLSEPIMQAVSPQVSAHSQVPPNGRMHSDASTMSLVSPISNSPAMPSYSPAPSGQRYQKPRMSSISEVHQQDLPWHLDFPAGATEQDIVRARQGQYMQERFTAQQQQQDERAAGSPSPRLSPEQTTLNTVPPHAQAHGGGFREILPRSFTQPYATSQAARSSQNLQPIIRRDATPVQPTPIHPGQSPPPAAYPLPMSPDPTVINSPQNFIASGFAPPPPPKIAHSPMRPGLSNAQPFSFEGQRPHSHSPSSPNYVYASSHGNGSQYDVKAQNEAPPSYDGPGVPNSGLDKSRPEGLRPLNITTDLDGEPRDRQPDSRPRQPSIGILQHPQPASMAASPQRTSPDMGAESLRRQLLQQENLAHMERVQREKEKRERHERDRQEREAARARARELERSASGGGQVGSLRSIGGSTTGGALTWERRGSHSNSRQVFELPAVEDDEPTMKATSYPGQEWVPPMWDGD